MSPAEADEAKNAFWWLYSLDKGMAINFGRSPQLLDYDIDVEYPETPSFNDQNPAYWILCKAYVDMARIQGQIYVELYSVSASRQPIEKRERVITTLANDLKEWWARASVSFKGNSAFETEPDLVAETYLFAFGYYTTLAIIYRVRSTYERTIPGRPPYDEECLSAARRALALCTEIQNNFPDPGSVSSIAKWIFLYYPLTPFFILFGNVVTTGDIEDLKRLEATVNFLSFVREESEGLEKLCKLTTIFYRVASILGRMPKGWQRRAKPNAFTTAPIPPIPEHSQPSDSGLGSYSSSRTTPSTAPPSTSLPQTNPAMSLDATGFVPIDTAGVGGANIDMDEFFDTEMMQNMDWEFFAQQPNMNMFASGALDEFGYLLNEEGSGFHAGGADGLEGQL